MTGPMTGSQADRRRKAPASLRFDYELDAPPQKVWRALSIAEFRDNWLPATALAQSEAVTVTPGEEVSYRMRESEPPYLESTITFRIAPDGQGGTVLRIVHELDRARPEPVAANGNRTTLMRAA